MFSLIMFSLIMFSLIMFSLIMFSFIMFSLIMFSLIMLLYFSMWLNAHSKHIVVLYRTWVFIQTHPYNLARRQLTTARKILIIIMLSEIEIQWIARNTAI